jgi:hypothetical protein
MDVPAILALILKGVAVIETLIAAGQSVAPAIKVITDLVSGAQAGTVTDEQLTETETALDIMIADFNQPMT